MSVRDGGYASFQECSFSGNTAVNEVSSFLLNLLIDLFVILSFFVFVFLFFYHILSLLCFDSVLVSLFFFCSS